MSGARFGLTVVAGVTAVVTAVPPAPAGAAAPDPVVVVAGTFSPAIVNWPLAQRLRHDGYDTTVFQIPTLGTQSISKSAKALATFVDEVRTSTGASHVDLVGHSQGGLVARSYVKDHGGASAVDSLITLGTPNRGTRVANLADVLGFGDCLGVVACRQMMVGSRWLRRLNAGDDTIGSVRYTTIRTTYDELVRPVGRATLRDGATNVKIQRQCPLRVVGHVGLILDGTVYSGVRQALDKQRPIALRCWAG